MDQHTHLILRGMAQWPDHVRSSGKRLRVLAIGGPDTGVQTSHLEKAHVHCPLLKPPLAGSSVGVQRGAFTPADTWLISNQ